MTVIRTRTPAGEAIVILPEDDFERLVDRAEDAADSDTIGRSQTALAQNDEELLSEADLDALRHAAAPTAFWRHKRGLSENELAARSGVDLQILAAVERGEDARDIRTYRRLATALGITIDDLVLAA